MAIIPLNSQNWDHEEIRTLCAVGELLESKIDHEIHLAGYRMTWLVVSESFLFSAFAVILTINAASLTTTARWLAICLPILGVSLASVVWPSLFAARKVIGALGELRGSIDERFKATAFPNWINTAIESRELWLRNTVTYGDFPIKFVPGLIIVAWIVAIIARLQFGSM